MTRRRSSPFPRTLAALALAFAAGCDVRPPDPEPARVARKVEYVVFTAKWCAACKGVPGVFEAVKEAVPDVTCRELDIDDKENERRSAGYGADGLPYNVVLADGKVVAKFRGFLPAADAARYLRLTLAKLDAAGE